MAAHYDRSVNVLAQSIVTFLASDDASSQVGREKPRSGASRPFWPMRPAGFAALLPPYACWRTRARAKPLPRAMVPSIQLDSPKITRKLTTAWFATRVDDPTSAACGSNRAAAAEIRIS